MQCWIYINVEGVHVVVLISIAMKGEGTLAMGKRGELQGTASRRP